VRKALEPLLANLVEGIKGTIQFLNSSEKIKKIILTGGGSRMKGIAEYLQGYLDFPIEEGDPFKEIKYPSVLQPRLKELGPILSVAIGASLREKY